MLGGPKLCTGMNMDMDMDIVHMDMDMVLHMLRQRKCIRTD